MPTVLGTLRKILTIMTVLDAIGRVAMLINLVSKPELNGAHVLVGKYDAAKDRFEVRTLRSPIEDEAKVLSMSVKLASLQFYTKSFMQSCPNAQPLRGSCLVYRSLEDTVIDFSKSSLENNVIPIQLQDGHPFLFDKSCHLIGAQSADGLALSQFRETTVIGTEDENAVIEIENIVFATERVFVALGNCIVFRNCCFKEKGVAIHNEKGSRRVLFENCRFEEIGGDRTALLIGMETRVTLLNCLFRNGSHGISLANVLNTSVTVKHCTFENMNYGIYAPLADCTVDIENSSFVDIKYEAVSALDGATVSLHQCRIQRCGMAGVQIRGPKRVNVVVSKCIISECQTGVRITLGKTDVTITNTEVRNCEFYGLYMYQDIVGKIDVTNCKIAGNGRRDILDMCWEHASFTIDGVLQNHHKGADAQQYINDLAELESRDTRRRRTASLQHMRAHKRAGTGNVTCSYCNAVEPGEVKFSVCSQCQSVCYCSRVCQTAHWKAAHKAECHPVPQCLKDFKKKHLAKDK